MDSETQELSFVRLKYFLARQIEKRGKHGKHGSKVTPQEAAILASLMWTEQYGTGPLNQISLCQLLGILPTRMTFVMGSLEELGLVEQDASATQKGICYRISDKGRASVAQFADQVLAIPKNVEDQLLEHGEYSRWIGVSGEFIDEYLREHFNRAKSARAARRPK